MNQKPNFIVIHTDQHRYDCVGVAGRREGIYTPYIDSIAYQGANFTSVFLFWPARHQNIMDFSPIWGFPILL